MMKIMRAGPPFLHLTGPSRAIVADEPVFFQIELKLKYGAQFKDTALFIAYQRYRPMKKYDIMLINSRCCTAEISLERFAPSIQATIVGVRVVEGESFNYGCKVSCFFFRVEEQCWEAPWKLFCLTAVVKGCMLD
uniref:DUF6598 domain-containing protein n=1 Tax=Aegilops tauschii subsp. strangulata TaxID=200361 RepID=A0A453DLN5_AEGTS